MIKKIFAIILIVFLHSCTFNQVPTKVLSHPEYKMEPTPDQLVRIAIASTQNFEGSLHSSNISLPKIEGVSSTNSPITLGGIDYLSSYVKILRKIYGNSLVLLDSGNIFDSKSPEKIPSIVQAYNKLGYQGINLTDRELKVLSDVNYEGANLPFISSNIIDLKTLKPTSIYGSEEAKIIDINDVKVGIISITTFNAVQDKKDDYKRGLIFEDPVLSFLKMRKSLKANVLVLVVTSNSIDDIHKYIKRLPPNSVDVIVSGNTFSSATEIEGIPLLQNPGKGQYISTVELYFDKQDKVIVADKTVNFGPTKTCNRFFRSTMDCHVSTSGDESSKRIELITDSKLETIPAKFLGHEIQADKEYSSLISK